MKISTGSRQASACCPPSRDRAEEPSSSTARACNGATIRHVLWAMAQANPLWKASIMAASTSGRTLWPVHNPERRSPLSTGAAAPWGNAVPAHHEHVRPGLRGCPSRVETMCSSGKVLDDPRQNISCNLGTNWRLANLENECHRQTPGVVRSRTQRFHGPTSDGVRCQRS